MAKTTVTAAKAVKTTETNVAKTAVKTTKTNVVKTAGKTTETSIAKTVGKNGERTASESVAKNTQAEFEREQLLASARYRDKRDLVEALLKDNEKYTIEIVDRLIDEFMKGQVK